MAVDQTLEKKRARLRSAVLEAILAASENWAEVSALVARSSTSEEARARVMERLGVDDFVAQFVLDMPLAHLVQEARQRRTDELAELKKSRKPPPARPAN